MDKIPIRLQGPGIQIAISRFFWKLYCTRKPKEEVSYSTKLEYLIKFSLGLFYFSVVNPSRKRFITWVTQYYPFSLLFRESLLHAENQKVRAFMRGLEEIAIKEGLSIYVMNGQGGKEMSTFEGFFENKVSDKEEKIGKLEEIFQKKFQTIFVRSTEEGFTVIVPSSLLGA